MGRPSDKFGCDGHLAPWSSVRLLRFLAFHYTSHSFTLCFYSHRLFFGHLNVLMTHRSIAVAFCGRRSVLERNCVLMSMSGFLPSLKLKRRSNDPSLRHPPKSRSCDSDRKFLTGHDDTYIDFSVVSWICKNMTKQRPRTSGIEESACDYRYI